jgi:hypothetical protein
MIIARSPAASYQPTLTFWSTGSTVEVLASGVTTYLQIDNRIVDITGDTDGFRLTVSGGTREFESDVYPLSGNSLSVYDLVDRIQTAINAVDAATDVVASVNANLGVTLTVTGSSGNTIVLRAPTGVTAFDIRAKLFGSAGDESTSLGDDPNEFEGAICTNYAADELVLEMVNGTTLNVVTMCSLLVLGIK